MSFGVPGVSLAAGSSVVPTPVSTDINQTGLVRPRRQGAESVAAQIWLPGDSGYLAWTFDPVAASGVVTPIAGAMAMMAFKWPGGFINQVQYAIASVGVTLTANQCFIGLYYIPGVPFEAQAPLANQFNFATAPATLIGITADQSANFSGSVGTKSAFFQTPIAGQPNGVNFSSVSIDAGVFLLAFLANGTTMPGFVGAAISNAPLAGRLANAIISPRSARSTVTGITTALPADLTGGVTQINSAIWAGIF